MDIKDLLKEKREEILRIAAKHGAYNVRIFGSVARGEAGPESDVDLLVDVGPNHTPFFPGGLIADLEYLVGRRVQVITEKGLHWYIRDRVLKEAVSLERFDWPEPRRLETSNDRVPVKDERLYLIRILEFCKRLEKISCEGRDAFLKSEVMLHAARYSLGMIARMARKLSASTPAAAKVSCEPVLGWEAMLGLDDPFKSEEVWVILERDVPELKQKVEAILKDLEKKT